MTVELPDTLEPALQQKATACGVSPSIYITEIVERDLGASITPEADRPFKSGLGMWANRGISLSEEAIDENRADMLRHSVFSSDAE